MRARARRSQRESGQDAWQLQHKHNQPTTSHSRTTGTLTNDSDRQAQQRAREVQAKRQPVGGELPGHLGAAVDVDHVVVLLGHALARVHGADGAQPVQRLRELHTQRNKNRSWRTTLSHTTDLAVDGRARNGGQALQLGAGALVVLHHTRNSTSSQTTAHRAAKTSTNGKLQRRNETYQLHEAVEHHDRGQRGQEQALHTPHE